MGVSTLCRSFNNTSVAMHKWIQIILPIYISLTKNLQLPTSCESVSTLHRDLSFTPALVSVPLFKENCDIFQSLLDNFVSGRKNQKTTHACRCTEHAEKIRFVVFLHNLESR